MQQKHDEFLVRSLVPEPSLDCEALFPQEELQQRSKAWADTNREAWALECLGVVAMFFLW